MWRGKGCLVAVDVMKELPRCSIIVPTYNRAATLPRAIASVIGQREPNFELIIIDNGSTDETRAWLATLDDPRIRVKVSEYSQASATRNIGIDMATAPVLAFLNSDDILLLRSIVSAIGRT